MHEDARSTKSREVLEAVREKNIASSERKVLTYLAANL